MINLKRLGNALRDARMARGMNQTQLAEALGTTQSKVSTLERGNITPDVNTVARLCRWMGRSIYDFEEQEAQAA